MIKVKFKIILFFRILRFFIIINGLLASVFLILAFTSVPFWGYHWLGTSLSEINEEPGTIILLGGGGMPGESSLIRSWYVSKAVKSFPECSVIIAVPGNYQDTASTLIKIKNELIIRGVNASSVEFEGEGTNTRSQALNCSKIISNTESILLVTSPEHMRRSILTFKKAGFQEVNALPAFEDVLESDLSFDEDLLGGNNLLIPEVGSRTGIRYQFWNHLKYEILILREALALTYYKAKGWI